MIELSEIEELFKSQDLIKSRAKLKALLQHAATFHDEAASPQQKQVALENIKAITEFKTKKPAKPKTTSPNEEQPTPSQSSHIHYKYSPVYGKHYGISEESWNAAKPEHHAELFQYHNDVMAGKHPDKMHIKNEIEQQKATAVKKSIDNLFDLFKQLKERV